MADERIGENMHQLNEWLKQAIPGYEEWKTVWKSERQQEKEHNRRRFLSLAESHYPARLAELSQKDMLFLLQQTQLMHFDLRKQSAPKKDTASGMLDITVLYPFLRLSAQSYDETIEQMTATEKMFLSGTLQMFQKQMGEIYRKGLQEWVFANRSYQVKDLMEDIDEIGLLRLVKERAPDFLEDCMHLYGQLSFSAPMEPEEPTYIHLTYHSESGYVCHEVSGLVESRLECQPIELQTYGEWLSYYIGSDTLEFYSKEEILFYFLRDMWLLAELE